MLTMIDPATGWFEVKQIESRRADYVINYLEFAWLTRYPSPTEIIFDRGSEFKAEEERHIHNDYGIKKKLITTRNPQANAMVERIHQVVGQLIDMQEIKGKKDPPKPFGWRGILSAMHQAVCSTVHTTTRAMPTQLVFGRDAILNVSFEADWQCIKQRKQTLIQQNNRRENKDRIPHQCQSETAS